MTNTEIFVEFVKESSFEKRVEIANKHPELFWDVNYYPHPRGSLIREAISNPQPTRELAHKQHKLPIMDAWDRVLVCLPDGEWVQAASDSVWTETDNYVICWKNDEELIAHLIRK